MISAFVEATVASCMAQDSYLYLSVKKNTSLLLGFVLGIGPSISIAPNSSGPVAGTVVVLPDAGFPCLVQCLTDSGYCCICIISHMWPMKFALQCMVDNCSAGSPARMWYCTNYSTREMMLAQSSV